MTLTTIWGDDLDSAHPLPAYPRPQLVRPQWSNLNGQWQYAITAIASADPLDVSDPLEAPTFAGTITVPFSPETPLSGVGHILTADEVLWYRREFAYAAPVDGERVLLHFGAVDQTCRIAVNGVEVGSNTGGYLPFTLDVTAALAGRTEHEIVVTVRDVTDASWLSRGKQKTKRGGIWYTPQSGIWQTVWLETVPTLAIERLFLTPALDDGEVEVVVLSHAAPADATAHVVVRSGADVVAEADIAVNAPVRVALGGSVRTWSPEDPHLYDVIVTFGEDEVASYVGMRSFGRGTDARGNACLLLNGEPYIPVGLLDQGYWPDGGYTAPSDEALEYDVRLAKDMGFTMLRKHIKVEAARWYHHCDRLGMLVWQDHVSGGSRYNDLIVTAPAIFSPRVSDRLYPLFGRADAGGRSMSEAELVDMIQHLRSVVSISAWVPFNEGWGQFDAARIADVVAAIDPTRAVDHASGWHEQGAGDMLSKHIYFRSIAVPEKWRRDGRVIALSEYGGYGHSVEGHTWPKMFSTYKKYATTGELEQAFRALANDQIIPAIRDGLAATVYTQLSDVEDELNGMVTYDRRVVKIPVSAVREVTDAMRAAFHEGVTP